MSFEPTALGDIGRLMAELDEVKFERDEFRVERDAAFVRGLERTIEILRLSPTMTVSKYWLVAAIQAEIEKAKAGSCRNCKKPMQGKVGQ